MKRELKFIEKKQKIMIDNEIFFIIIIKWIVLKRTYIKSRTNRKYDLIYFNFSFIPAL